MALITRLSRLFSADFHAVLDRIEEPELLLKQAIREMEEELARSEQRIKHLQQEQRQLAAQEDEIEQALSNMDEEMDICFASGEEDLARKLVKRKLEKQLLLNSIAGRCRSGARTLVELQASVAENRSRLQSMRQKAELLLAHDDTAALDPGWHADRATRDFAPRDEDVDVAFLREKQRRSPS